MQKGNHLDVKTTIAEVDELISKLKLANSLADELAKKNIDTKQVKISKVGAAQVIKIDL
ncbi:hypothetical protein [Latilactobacillus curvatus]|uniref:hypothetical protein n=1 Tax=Latilactobacillus curvatus TaxID=28038 RepID=UPI0012FDCA13|nr:hypothetical protein [Latilactobacillus curvatus]